MKRCSTSFIIKAMYIKAILSYYFSPIRLAKIQRTSEWCDVAALREHVFSYISYWEF